MKMKISALTVFVLLSMASGQVLPGLEEFPFGVKCAESHKILKSKSLEPIGGFAQGCKQLNVQDFPWMGSSYLATLSYNLNELNSFVMTRQESVNSSELSNALGKFMNALQPRYGFPDKAMVLPPVDRYLDKFPSGVAVEVAQWALKKELYKLTVLRVDSEYTWSFSGVKTKK